MLINRCFIYVQVYISASYCDGVHTRRHYGELRISDRNGIHTSSIPATLVSARVNCSAMCLSVSTTCGDCLNYICGKYKEIMRFTTIHQSLCAALATVSKPLPLAPAATRAHKTRTVRSMLVEKGGQLTTFSANYGSI